LRLPTSVKATTACITKKIMAAVSVFWIFCSGLARRQEITMTKIKRNQLANRNMFGMATLLLSPPACILTEFSLPSQHASRWHPCLRNCPPDARARCLCASACPINFCSALTSIPFCRNSKAKARRKSCMPGVGNLALAVKSVSLDQNPHQYRY